MSTSPKSTTPTAGVSVTQYFTLGSHWGVRISDGHTCISPFGAPQYPYGFNLIDENFFHQAGGEVAYLMQRVGTYGSYVNPVFKLGRMFWDSIDAMEFRLMFSDDSAETSEHPCVVLENTGTVASVRGVGTGVSTPTNSAGSHFEGWNKNGDTKPNFRINGAGGLALELGPGGSSETDVGIRRYASGVARVDNGSPANAGAVLEFLEIADPAAGDANTARVYAKDNGAGKSLTVVKFNTGAVQTTATQP